MEIDPSDGVVKTVKIRRASTYPLGTGLILDLIRESRDGGVGLEKWIPILLAAPPAKGFAPRYQSYKPRTSHPAG
jgi:hypothetical protein